MSNRVLGLLIILWFILLWVLFFLYFFVYYTGQIVINTNVENYKVELYNKKLLKTDVINCENNKCILGEISPFEYSIKISKTDYIDYLEEFEIWRNEILEIDVELEKKISLEKISEVQIEEWSEINREEKMNFLREKSNVYKSFDFWASWIYYFKIENNNLVLYKNLEKLFVWEITSEEDINIMQIYGDDNSILIILWEKKYLYSIISKIETPVLLNIDIKYVKKANSKSIFHFVTEKWSFIFNRNTWELEYFSYFDDFVYYQDLYIWIINKSDERRLKNLWLEKQKDNLIIKYNPQTKEKKVLYSTDLEIKKIYKQSEDIIFVSSDNNSYKLENFR